MSYLRFFPCVLAPLREVSAQKPGFTQRCQVANFGKFKLRHSQIRRPRRHRTLRRQSNFRRPRWRDYLGNCGAADIGKVGLRNSKLGHQRPLHSCRLLVGCALGNWLSDVSQAASCASLVNAIYLRPSNLVNAPYRMAVLCACQKAVAAGEIFTGVLK